MEPGRRWLQARVCNPPCFLRFSVTRDVMTTYGERKGQSRIIFACTLTYRQPDKTITGTISIAAE